MIVNILAAGSHGNCIAVRSGSTTILIDAGIPKSKIERRLLDAGIRPDHIKTIMISHAHKDHTKGLAIANKYRIPVYASEGEWRDIKGVDEELRETLEPFSHTYLFGYTLVETFRTHHDAFEPLGFVIEDDEGKRCAICLDTGHVDDDMLKVMSHSDIYIIEANHEPELVRLSDYPDRVKARILGDNGHLSNQQAAEALAKLVQGKGERVILTHLSRDNNHPDIAMGTVEAALRDKGFVNGKHYTLEVV